jgi:sugar phosphate isomerase/epimerase
MVGRFFPGNWRPPAEEIRFASGAGFDVVQIRSDEPGRIEELLRVDLDEVRESLEAAGVEAALEMLVRFESDGRTVDGDTVPQALARNLDAIAALGIRRVHVHPVRAHRRDGVELQRRLVPALAEAAELAADRSLLLGVEHNDRDHVLFARPDACAELLDAAPGLGFVWDVNHTAAADLAAFEALLPRASLVHVSDTPLPETNHHLPLGRGTVDLPRALAALVESGFGGPLVLEIGGLPKSGGYGLDTDDALRDSRARLLEAL